MTKSVETVVIVDDDPLVLDIMADALSKIGVMVVAASTITEALRWLDEKPTRAIEPLLFLVDVIMPDGDGFEFIRALADRGCRAPVIVMTGCGELYLRLAHNFGAAFDVNIIDLMTKPIDYQRLLSRIEGLPQTRVLVVDDEPISLETATAIFTRAGFDVLSANCGADALRQLEDDGGIDLLVTDNDMPEMSGIELALKAARLHPDIKILMVSAASAETGSAIPFLQKPYQPSELVTLVRGMITHA